MKKTLLAEEAAQLAIAVIGLYLQPLHFSWWTWIVLFLSPDIGMLGYLANTGVGAFTYNLFHHKLTAILILLAGYFLHNDLTLFIGMLLFAHSCFDRVLGYGLKFADDFKHTHLGMIGSKQEIE